MGGRTVRSPEERNELVARARSGRKAYGLRGRKRNSDMTDLEYQKGVAVVLRISGFTYKEIALIVNSHPDSIKRWFQDPKVQEDYNEMKLAVTKAGRRLLEAYVIEAIEGIHHVLRTAENPKFILDAASEILDRAGLAKVSRNEKKVEHEHEHKLTEKGTPLLERLREAPPEIQEKAAQGIEELEQMLETAMNKNKAGEE